MSQAVEVSLTRAQRRRTERALFDLWERRDIPAMTLEAVRALTDAALVHVHRFWSHKDRHWCNSEQCLAKQPNFTEDPPFGWDAFSKAGLPNGLKPSVPGNGREPRKIIRGDNSGLTPRQALKIHG